jgi:hypothetical protein
VSSVGREVCDLLGGEDDRYPAVPGARFVITPVEETVCDMFVGEDRRDYDTTLDCVLHPFDEAVCQAIEGEHRHNGSALDGLLIVR